MIEIIDETSRFPHVEQVETVLSRYLSELGLAGRGLTVVLLDDAAMRGFNREHRGTDETTDVLSYPTAEPDDTEMPRVEHLGDILISVDTARRQAAGHGHGLLAEVLMLAAHGVTHLRGFDHATEEQWQTFHEAQQRILTLESAS